MKIRKPIILLGTGRSGTSIVTDIIMRHKDLAFPSIYNDVFYKYPIINILRNVFDNPFWRVFGEKNQLNRVSILNNYIFRHSEPYHMWDYLTGEETDFSRNYLLNQTPDKNTINKIHEYFNKMLIYQNKKRLAFKLTGAPKIGYLKTIFPDARFIIFKRNFIPTLSSFLKVDFWKDKGYKQIWVKGAYRKNEIELANELKNSPLLLTALQLKKMNEVFDFEIQKHNPFKLIINYENFVDSPSLIIKKILSFLGLSEDMACFQFLNQKKIINRNKEDIEYFDKDELSSIKEIFDYENELKL